MQAKSTRGVQAHDVAKAADELIAEGQRPTIERVRLRLGRGSPNTIAPLLDGWFSQLGARLGVAHLSNEGESGPAQGVPSVVVESMQSIWTHALAEATTQARCSFEEQLHRLHDQQAKLETARRALEADRAQANQREVLLQHNVKRLEAEVSQWQRAAQKWEGTASDLERDLRKAREELGKLIHERSEERLRYDERIQLFVIEQRRQAQAAQAEHQRLLMQIDRERQAHARCEKKLSEANEAAATDRVELQRVNSALGKRFHEAELEIVSLQARYQSQDELVTSLQTRLAALESKPPTSSRKRPLKVRAAPK